MTGKSQNKKYSCAVNDHLWALSGILRQDQATFKLFEKVTLEGIFCLVANIMVAKA